MDCKVVTTAVEPSLGTCPYLSPAVKQEGARALYRIHTINAYTDGDKTIRY